jgi:hypothetical protein
MSVAADPVGAGVEVVTPAAALQVEYPHVVGAGLGAGLVVEAPGAPVIALQPLLLSILVPRRMENRRVGFTAL